MADLQESGLRLRLSLRAPESARMLTGEHREWLRASLQGDPRSSLEDVIDDLWHERAQLWEVGDGKARLLLVTRLVEYERCWALQIQLCAGGDLAECLPLLPELEQHARNLGCRFLELQGRRGWERVLPGFDFRGIALAKEL